MRATRSSTLTGAVSKSVINVGNRATCVMPVGVSPRSYIHRLRLDSEIDSPRYKPSHAGGQRPNRGRLSSFAKSDAPRMISADLGHGRWKVYKAESVVAQLSACELSHGMIISSGRFRTDFDRDPEI